MLSLLMVLFHSALTQPLRKGAAASCLQIVLLHRREQVADGVALLLHRLPSGKLSPTMLIWLLVWSRQTPSIKHLHPHRIYLNSVVLMHHSIAKTPSVHQPWQRRAPWTAQGLLAQTQRPQEDIMSPHMRPARVVTPLLLLL